MNMKQFYYTKWLEAFESGNDELIERYAKKYANAKEEEKAEKESNKAGYILIGMASLTFISPFISYAIHLAFWR